MLTDDLRVSGHHSLQRRCVFWPSALQQLSLRDGQVVLGKVVDRQVIPDQPEAYRIQLKVGNRDAYGLDFRWVDEADIERMSGQYRRRF